MLWRESEQRRWSAWRVVLLSLILCVLGWAGVMIVPASWTNAGIGNVLLGALLLASGLTAASVICLLNRYE